MKSLKALNLLFLALLVCLSCGPSKIKSQQEARYTVANLQALAQAKFQINTAQLTPCPWYIIDGSLVSETAIDSVLKTIAVKDYRMIQFLQDVSKHLYANVDCDYAAIIQTKKTKQALSYKRNIIDSVVGLYQAFNNQTRIAGSYCQNCPLVLVNNRPYASEQEVERQLRALPLRKVAFVALYNQPLNPVLYGRMGAQGAVEIFLEE